MRRIILFISLPLLCSCSVSKNYNPDKKYSKQQLQQDFSLLRNILQDKHPSVYWYTPHDSMDLYFDNFYKSISDSMTELQFAWNVIAPLTAKIHCGHTSFNMSKSWVHFVRNRFIPSFPLYLKVWNDTMMVIGNLSHSNQLISKGAFIHSINGISNADLISYMFRFMVEDGYSENVNYIRLSSDFPFFHRNIFGLYKSYFVNYTDSDGVAKNTVLPYYKPTVDTSKKKKKTFKKVKWTREERLQSLRSIDYSADYTLMTVNGFSKGNLKQFFRRSFRQLRKSKTKNLVIDIRANGGGDLIKSAFLTRYLRATPFKIADTVFAVCNNFRPYSKYISGSFFNNLGLRFVTHKEKDGKFHFGYWEKHVFKPKRRNHFSGNVFILTNGLTFSASSVFCNALKGQQNVTLVGEETGGGWYGNSGILIPDITLPNTKLRVRLPLFRLVQFEHIPIKGTGVMPDVYVGPDWRDILNGTDTKMEVVGQIIRERARKDGGKN